MIILIERNKLHFLLITDHLLLILISSNYNSIINIDHIHLFRQKCGLQ
jgi:hypothetical protein